MQRLSEWRTSKPALNRAKSSRKQRSRQFFFERLEERSLLAAEVISLAGVTSNTAAGESGDPAFSSDGRYVAFSSNASNLVVGDTNGQSDIFVRDNQTGLVTLVSTGSAGAQGNRGSYYPAISSDGRYVAFLSRASNLVVGDSNQVTDIFLKDIQTGTLTRVSATSAGVGANAESFSPSISGDGRYVVFPSRASNLVAGDTNGHSDIFVKDTQTGTVTRVSTGTGDVEGNNHSIHPDISGNGRYVTFRSAASNLVPGDTNGVEDIFVKDVQTGALSRVSTSSTGDQGNGLSELPSISSDGRYVAFASHASNLVPDNNGEADIYLKDTQTGWLTLVSSDSAGIPGNHPSSTSSISDDGRYVAFESMASILVTNDTNHLPDVFVKNTYTGGVTLASTGSTGTQGDDSSYRASISGDGRSLAFWSGATNLVSGDNNRFWDVFIKDIPSGALNLATAAITGLQVTPDAGATGITTISSDGRYVVFASASTNLVFGDTNKAMDVFLKDTQTGAVRLVSSNSAGVQSNSLSLEPSISGNGRYVALQSFASNLVAGDTNRAYDIFLKDIHTGAVVRVSTGSSGNQANGPSYEPSVSSDGRYVVFRSAASNLVPGDTNGVEDIFVKDVQTGAITRVSTDSLGNEANAHSYETAVSGDGRYVVFRSAASNLVAGDTNGVDDIFVKDVQTGAITRVSEDSAGNQANNSSFQPSISGDGRFIAFRSTASNLVTGDTNDVDDIFMKDIQTGAVTRLSTNSAGNQANKKSSEPSISGDGRFIAFRSTASNLVAGDTNGVDDIFVKDVETGAVTRLSTNSAGNQANGISLAPQISLDGRYVSFNSSASNLFPYDGNTRVDAFRARNPLANHRATFSGKAAGRVAEDGTLTTSGTLTVTDADEGEAKFQPRDSLAGTYGTFTFNVDTGEWSYTLDNSDTIVQKLAGSERVTDILTVQSSDGSASQNIAVTIRGTNDAPVLNVALTPSLGTIREDAFNTIGKRIEALVAGIRDVDANAKKGIAITNLEGGGTWQFSLDDGAHWKNIGSVSFNAARLLAANGQTRLRFVPNRDFAGTVRIWYRAWDQSSGTPGQMLDLAGKTGSSGSVSAQVEVAALTVTAVNDRLVLGGIAGTLGYHLNAPAVAFVPTATDVHSPNLWKGVLRVKVASGADGSERLEIGGAFTRSGQRILLDGQPIGLMNAGGGIGATELAITFESRATTAVVQQLIRSLTFRTEGSSSQAQRVIDFYLSDAGGESVKRTKTLTVIQ